MRRSHNPKQPMSLTNPPALVGHVEIALKLARCVVPTQFVYDAVVEIAEAKRAEHAGTDFVEDLACAEVCRVIHAGLTDDHWPSPKGKEDAGNA